MKPTDAKIRFRLLRSFSLISLVGILIAALVLAVLYREIAISTLTDMGETVNVTLAHTALNSVRGELVEYLNGLGGTDPATEINPSNPLETVVQHLLRVSGIAKIKVYNRSGTVAYSTTASQIGHAQPDNPGVIAALGGGAASKFIYRDHLNPFDGEHSDANMIQSYLPIREDDLGKVLGVFEIYTDISPLTVHTEQAQLLIFPVVLGIFLILYLVLLAVVRRAEVSIRRQDDIICERNHTLEILSAKLLSAQEQERKQLAHVLHEEVAQILSAIKLKLENTCHGQPECDVVAQQIGPLEAYLKDAIQDVRTLAMRIRPSTLDNMGLLETLNWYLRELGELYPGIEIRRNFQAAEKDIPKPLKIIIYRIVQDTLNNLTAETEADNIGIVLRKKKDFIELFINENSIDYIKGLATEDEQAKNNFFILMNERTVLSGGEYGRDKNSAGIAHHVSSWRV